MTPAHEAIAHTVDSLQLTIRVLEPAAENDPHVRAELTVARALAERLIVRLALVAPDDFRPRFAGW